MNCVICNGSLPSTKKGTPAKNRKYCGKDCAEKGQVIELKKLADSRRKGVGPHRKCKECGKEFTAGRYQTRALYCGKDCAAAGLAQAIERQRIRRKEEKMDRLGRGKDGEIIITG